MRHPRPNRNAPPRLPQTLAEEVRSGGPFESVAALEAGLITRHRLATHYRVLLPGIHVPLGTELSQWERITAVSMWAPADGVIAGWAAAHILGEHWISPEHRHRCVDMYSELTLKAPFIVRWRRVRRPIAPEDQTLIGRIPITAPARTAVDVARWTSSDDRAICAVDSICNSTGTTIASVSAAADRMRGLHGVRRVLGLLPDCDHLADSPQESLLRLRIFRSSLPKPVSQLVIRDRQGRKVVTADLGYEREKVAIFYDGHVHGRAEQWRWDLRVNAVLADLGWEVVRITRGMSPDEVIGHIEKALQRARRRGAV